MEKTGIVRRVDELGRVVIPKEIRKTMHIKEGEEMEVFVSNGDSLILKKYSPIKTIRKLSEEYAEILRLNTGYNCLICDTDEIIAEGGDKKVLIGKRISKALEMRLKERSSAYYRKADGFCIIPGTDYCDVAISPIITNGDVVGGMMLIAETAMTKTDNCIKLLEVGAGFFAKQIEE